MINPDGTIQLIPGATAANILTNPDGTMSLLKPDGTSSIIEGAKAGLVSQITSPLTSLNPVDATNLIEALNSGENLATASVLGKFNTTYADAANTVLGLNGTVTKQLNNFSVPIPTDEERTAMINDATKSA